MSASPFLVAIEAMRRCPGVDTTDQVGRARTLQVSARWSTSRALTLTARYQPDIVALPVMDPAQSGMDRKEQKMSNAKTISAALEGAEDFLNGFTDCDDNGILATSLVNRIYEAKRAASDTFGKLRVLQDEARATAEAAYELMARAEAIDRKLAAAGGIERDCELGQIARMRAQLSRLNAAAGAGS